MLKNEIDLKEFEKDMDVKELEKFGVVEKVTYPKKIDGFKIENEQQLFKFTVNLLLERDYYRKLLKEKNKEINMLRLNSSTITGKISIDGFIKVYLQSGLVVETKRVVRILDKIDRQLPAEQSFLKGYIRGVKDRLKSGTF